MTFVVAVAQRKLLGKGKTSLYNTINDYKSKDVIPVFPKNSVWYDFWRYSHLIQ